MKGIPADEFVYMIKLAFKDAPYSPVTKEYVTKLIDQYGDDYFLECQRMNGLREYYIKELAGQEESK